MCELLTIWSPFDHSIMGAGFPSIGQTSFTWATPIMMMMIMMPMMMLRVMMVNLIPKPC